MRVAFCVVLLSVASRALGQFTDSTNYYVHYISGGTVNKTNDGNSYVLNNVLKFNSYRRSTSINTTNSWIYGQQLERKTNNDFSSLLDINLFRNERHVFYWALAGYEKSLSLKIMNRLQAGAGIGYYVIDRDAFVFQVSNGALYERNDLDNREPSMRPDYETLRNSFRIKLRVAVLDKITLDNTDFFQHAYANRKDYIIRSVTTLSIKLLKWIAVTISVNYNKLSATRRENLIITYGLTVDRYF